MSGFVFLSSYPKSGNTWLRAIVESLRADGADVDINANLAAILPAADRATFDRLMDVESVGLPLTEIAWARPQMWSRLASHGANQPLIKVHDALIAPLPGFSPPVPADAIERVIYIARDPRDVAVSLAHHFDLSVDGAISAMADEFAFLDLPAEPAPKQLPQLISSWSRHVESWLDAPGILHLLVRYEDMHAAPEMVVRQIADFLGIPTTEASLAATISATRFRALRAQEERVGFVERESSANYFFRRGVVGSWRQDLSRHQAAQIARDHGAVMERLGYEA